MAVPCKVLFLLTLFWYHWDLQNGQHSSEEGDLTDKQRQRYSNTTTSPRLIQIRVKTLNGQSESRRFTFVWARSRHDVFLKFDWPLWKLKLLSLGLLSLLNPVDERTVLLPNQVSNMEDALAGIVHLNITVSIGSVCYLPSQTSRYRCCETGNDGKLNCGFTVEESTFVMDIFDHLLYLLVLNLSCLFLSKNISSLLADKDVLFSCWRSYFCLIVKHAICYIVLLLCSMVSLRFLWLTIVLFLNQYPLLFIPIAMVIYHYGYDLFSLNRYYSGSGNCSLITLNCSTGFDLFSAFQNTVGSVARVELMLLSVLLIFIIFPEMYIANVQSTSGSILTVSFVLAIYMFPCFVYLNFPDILSLRRNRKILYKVTALADSKLALSKLRFQNVIARQTRKKIRQRHTTSEASTSNTSSCLIDQRGGSVSAQNVSVDVLPDSVQEQTEIRVTLEDPVMHYHPFLQIGLINDVIFAAPVIKLEPHGLAFTAPATVRVKLNKVKHPEDNIVVLHAMEKGGKRHWEDVTEQSIFREDENTVSIKLAHFSFIEVLFVRPWVQVKHILSKLQLISFEYRLTVFAKHDFVHPPYSELVLVFMSSDVYHLEAYREDKNSSITHLKNEGFEELSVRDSSPNNKLYNNGVVSHNEEIKITLDKLGSDMKFAPGINPEKSVKVDSTIWRSTGYALEFKLECTEDVKVFSGTVEIAGVLGHRLRAEFREKDISAYLKNVLSLESITNLVPVARRLGLTRDRLREIISKWESDDEQIHLILSTWTEMNGEEDPSKIKELMVELSPEEYRVSETGKFHVQRVRYLANEIQHFDNNDQDRARCFNQETQKLISSVLRDCCIETCCTEAEINDCLSSEQFVRFLLDKEQLTNDIAEQIRQVIIAAGVEETAPQKLMSAVAPLIQLVKEVFKVLPKVESLSGLWGLPAETIEKSQARIKEGLEELNCGKIVAEVCRVLEHLCLRNSNRTSSEEIKRWGECAGIIELLAILIPFLQTGQALKLRKRIELVAKSVRKILEDHSAHHSTTRDYVALSFSLFRFAAFDPTNLVQFKIEPFSKITISTSRSLEYDETEKTFCQSYKITKEKERDVELYVTAHVNIDRDEFKAGAFQAMVALNQEERESFERIRTRSEFSGVVTLLKEQLPETVMISCSRSKRDICVIDKVLQKEMNLKPGRVKCGCCPLPVRSCSKEQCLRLKLLYKKDEDVVRIESSDFEFCADPDGESKMWSLLEAADCFGDAVSHTEAIETAKDLITSNGGRIAEDEALVLRNGANLWSVDGFQRCIASKGGPLVVNNIMVLKDQRSSTTVNNQSTYKTNCYGNTAIGDQSAVRPEVRQEIEN